MKSIGQQEVFYNDVTLRDGEQAPGNTMTPPEKLAVATQLHATGISGIEAGFPNSSQPDFESVQAIAQEVGNTPLPRSSRESPYARISGLARLRRDDIERTVDAVQEAAHPGVHTFISTSKPQMVKFANLIEKRGGRAGNMRDFVDKVAVPDIEELLPAIRERLPHGVIQFSPEDWVRTDDKAVGNEVILAAVANGANVINLPDTVGIGIPSDIGERVRSVRAMLDKNGYRDVMISWHGHNDTGLSVANTIQAIHSGAEQVETTILGIGERTGNISFEAVLAALDANPERHAQLIYEMRMNPMSRAIYKKMVDLGWVTPRGMEISDTVVRKEVMATALLLSRILDKPIPAEHPIVGANAFAHESGIHADGLLKGKRGKNDKVYEILNPEDYGAVSKTVIGQQAGWANMQEFMEQHGLHYRQEDRAVFSMHMKTATAKRRKGISDEEVMQNIYYPSAIEVTGGPFVQSIEAHDQPDQPTRVVISTNEGEIKGESAEADGGMIDAVIHGLRAHIPGVDVTDFSVDKAESTGEGSSAPAIVRLALSNGSDVSVTVRHHKTQEAIKQAVIQAVNALYAVEKYKEPVAAVTE